jgi:hypothetical protein
MGDVWLAMNGSPEGELGVGYAAPVQRLLSIGEVRSHNPSEWPDYCARFGLQREHISDLIRMACDAGLNQADSSSNEVWAPMHAWRALGQLRAEEAVLPLLALLRAAEAQGSPHSILFFTWQSSAMTCSARLGSSSSAAFTAQ